MKNELDAIFHTFEHYIRQHDYFDILYSEKFGYIRVAAIGQSMEEEMNILNTPKKMLKALFNDIINDVVYSPDNPVKAHYGLDALTEYEETESRRRIAAILEAIENKADRDRYFSFLDEYIRAYQEGGLQG